MKFFAPIALLVIVIFVTGALFFQFPERNQQERTEPGVIRVATSTLVDNTDNYSIQADQPHFKIWPLDDKIREVTDEAIASFKIDIGPSEGGVKNEFRSSFDSVYIGEDFVSVRLILSRYHPGAAHGLDTGVGITFDRKHRTFVMPEEALAMTGLTLPQVSEEASAQLKDMFGSIGSPEGLSPDPKNYMDFVISRDAVNYFFQEYQAVAYAGGMPLIQIARNK